MDIVTKNQTAKYTPGPWEVNSGMVETATGIPIALMERKPGNGTKPTERDANARLISAAPELLEAAKDALESLRRLEDKDGAYRVTNIQQLQTAIRNATGE